MTTEELNNHLINSGFLALSLLPNEDLKEIREFLNNKTNEINWILKSRARAKRFANLQQQPKL